MGRRGGGAGRCDASGASETMRRFAPSVNPEGGGEGMDGTRE